MKRLFAFVLTLSMIFLLAAVGGSAAFADEAAKDADPAYLAGHWGGIEWILNGDNNPFYLDNIVSNATKVQFTLTVPVIPRGYPYGDWYLCALDQDGKNWDHIAKFHLDKDMTQGDPVTFKLALDGPSTFKALTISPVESDMDFTLWRLIDFYVDPACIPEEARGAEPASLADQLAEYIGRQLPLTRQSFAPAPFAAPGRISDVPSDPAYVPHDVPDPVRR